MHCKQNQQFTERERAIGYSFAQIQKTYESVMMVKYVIEKLVGFLLVHEVLVYSMDGADLNVLCMAEKSAHKLHIPRKCLANICHHAES